MIYLGSLLGFVWIMTFWSMKRPIYFSVGQAIQMKRSSLSTQDIIVLLVLTIFSGMRTEYNDTAQYILNFRACSDLFHLTMDDINIARNPFFVILQAILKIFTQDYHVLFLVCAFFVNFSVICFFRKYSENYMLSMILYIASGCFVIGMAAQKQIIAMAILLWSVPSLLKKNYLKFSLIVLCAAMFHFYAFVFLGAPFLLGEPWNKKHKIALGIACMGAVYFNQFIAFFLEIIETVVGRTSQYEGVEMNVFRILFHAILPIVIFICRNRIFRLADPSQKFFANAAIITFVILIFGFGGLANEVGRIARYFELIAIPTWSYIASRMRTVGQKWVVTLLIIIYYLIFFYYQYGVASEFMNVWK